MADPELAATRGRRRWLRWVLLGLASVVLAAVVAVYLFLPRLARPLLERTLSAALGAPVSIASLAWEPQSGRAVVEGIRIGDEQDANWAAVARVIADVRLDSLWGRDIVVERVAVTEPVGAVELDARYRPTMLPEEGGSAASLVLPRATIERLEVSGGRLAIRYPVKRGLHEKVLRITRLDSSDIAVSGDGVVMRATAEGTLDEAPLNAEIRLAVDAIDASLAVSGLPVHRDALDLPPGLETFRAVVDARAHYHSQTEPARHGVQLDLGLHEPSITDAGGSELAAAAIAMPDVAIDLLARTVTIATAAVEQPRGELRFDENYEPALPRFGAPGDAGESLDWDVAVGELTATDGTIMLRYPVGGAEHAAPLQVARAHATDVVVADGALALRGELDGSLDDAPVSGRLVLDGAERVEAELRLSGIAIDAETVPLPAGLEAFTATADVRATYRATPGDEVVSVETRLATPRLAIDGGPALSAAAVSVPDARIDLEARRVALGGVQVEAPRIELTVTDDGVQLPLPGNRESQEAQWTVAPGPIAVSDGEVRVRRGDASLTIGVPALDWAGDDAGGSLQLRGTAGQRGTFTARGTLTSTPAAAALDVDFEALPLPPLAALAGALPVGLSKGTADGDVEVAYADERLRAEGGIALHDVHTLPPDPGRPAEVMAVADATAQLALEWNGGLDLDVATLALSYPYLLAQRHRDGLFPTDLIGAAESNGGGGFSARIGRLAAEHGKIEFVDLTQEPDYWTSLSDFRAEARDVRLPAGTMASFSVAGKQDELSPIEVSGSLTARGLEARASVENILLPALNTYVSPLLGYDLTSGRLGFDVTVAPSPPLLAATAKVELRGVEVRQTGVDVVQAQSGVPLPIALSLISKRSGVIDLTVPVTVDTAKREVTLGSVVWQAIRNAIVTALTSPLRILGSLFGKSGAPHAFAIDPIPFPPGSGELDGAGAARVAEIARILSAHPGLLLVVQPQITATDLTVVGADAADLARARGAAVREALSGASAAPRLPEDRIMVVDWKPPSGAPAVDEPSVYVELQDLP